MEEVQLRQLHRKYMRPAYYLSDNLRVAIHCTIGKGPRRPQESAMDHVGRMNHLGSLQPRSTYVHVGQCETTWVRCRHCPRRTVGDHVGLMNHVGSLPQCPRRTVGDHVGLMNHVGSLPQCPRRTVRDRVGPMNHVGSPTPMST